MSNTADSTIPVHLGIILDGNRRWAKAKGLPSLEGHRKGYDNLKTIARSAFNKGIQYVSAYCFSTENWNRDKDEVNYLMDLAMKLATKDARQLIKENIKIVVLGVEDRVDPKLIKAWREAEADSAGNTGGTLCICFNYGGARELTDAVRQIVNSGVAADDVTEQTIADNLYHPEVPPVDFMIRTSGEQRTSNFMLWRLAYAELYFASVHWPDFNEAELDKALDEFANRNRRFGGN